MGKCPMSSRGIRCRASKNRVGAAVVEFAVIAPIFFTMVFGIIEFGRIILVQQLITNASREAARDASLTDSAGAPATPDATVISTTESRLQGQGIPGATVTINTVASADPTLGNRKEVSVVVPTSQVSWLNIPYFNFTPPQLQATTSMRVATPQ